MDKRLLETKGRIFNIQRFSIHDGPGIRTIIFLKGCRLRCKWCCNPESQEWDIQEMRTEGRIKPVGEDVTVEYVVSEAEKDRAYYRRSGGGITLSGGECLCQPEFSLAILKAAKEMGINTAIETAGYVERETLESVIPYVDTVLMDIKHMNGEKHKAFTSRDNAKILDNARCASANAKELIIRTPVIPTFNDTEEEIRDIASFAASIGVKEMHLLPYHRIGSDKYAGLGRAYEMSHIEPPKGERMRELSEIVSRTGLKCVIGG